MRLALVFDKFRDDAMGLYFERACQRLGIACDHFWTSRAEAIPSGYDLYLRIDHGDYQDDLPDHLRPKIFLASDTHLPKSFRRIHRLAKRYDLVCCVHRRGARRLGAAWVPAACDPELHGFVPPPAASAEGGSAPAAQALRAAAGGGTKRWDVAFVGTEGGTPRKFYLQALCERYPSHFIGHAPHTELGAIYSQAKIGFNYSIRDDINMRMFEVLCSGTLLLTNRLSHGDMEQLGFRDREHLVYYRSPQDLFALLDYYVSHPEEREAIARRGMTLAHAQHTYAHRLRQILDLAAQRLGRPRDHSPSRATREAFACTSS